MKKQYEPYIAGEAVVKWITHMSLLHPTRANSIAACCRMLGVTENTMAVYRKKGTDKRTALAMRALVHNFAPWGK